MKNVLKLILMVFLTSTIVSCGSDDSKKADAKKNDEKSNTQSKSVEIQNSDKIDVVGISYGVGEIKKGDVKLDDQINKSMANKGKAVFNKMCSACHKVDKKYIGPSPKGILARRTTEWVMNMILNPEKMIKEDAIAVSLLKEYGTPMTNQHVTKDEARQMLEYFRTL
ncbi:MAG: c-type cytochrome [Ichthyobacteriaceae bacterium]|nr:c-type cytochrome [Ichthyobacteriaceae bacterium]